MYGFELFFKEWFVYSFIGIIWIPQIAYDLKEARSFSISSTTVAIISINRVMIPVRKPLNIALL